MAPASLFQPLAALIHRCSCAVLQWRCCTAIPNPTQRARFHPKAEATNVRVVQSRRAVSSWHARQALPDLGTCEDSTTSQRRVRKRPMAPETDGAGAADV
eukprot:EG_transcript_10623